MAFKFLSIVKANQRIAELETQVATLTQEHTDLVASIAGNETEAVKSAETLTTKVAELTSQNAQLVADLATAKASIASEGAKIVALEAAAVSKDAEVASRVVKQAAETLAQLGQPGAPAIPTTAKTDNSNLFGIARVIAAEKAASAAKNSTK